MKVLLLGATGQLGWELQRSRPDKIKLITCDYPKVDFCSKASIKECLSTSKPDCIINCAAYTAVDKAEKEIKTAFKVNHEAVIHIAQYAALNEIGLIHISTDYVFNGENFKPWTPLDTPCPQSVYGESKLKGEQAVQTILKDKSLIIRTAWLYSSHGKNFVKTMLQLMADKNSLNIVDDQIGTPTWAYGLSEVVWKFVKEKKISGVFHWTDAGAASWYDFAVAIQEEAFASGLLTKMIPLLPVSSKQFPTPAKRPFYSILDKNNTRETIKSSPVHWRIQLRAMLKELN